MNTPKSDSFVMSKYASKESLYADLMLSHRQLETEVQELQWALAVLEQQLDYGQHDVALEYVRTLLEKTK